ncbi:MAG: heavy metal-binding domain-containing protein [Steroidobacteraceae bacterium]
MRVTAQSPNALTHQGTQVYFCSSECKTQFLANPAKYPVRTAAAEQTTPAIAKPNAVGATYSCPMHPQIRQVGAGACPICGMALERVDATVELGANPETLYMARRFWIGVPLALVVVVLAMGDDIRILPALAKAPWSPWAQFALSTPVVLWCGWPFLVRGCAVPSPPPTEHVYLDRDRSVSRIPLQCDGRSGTPAVSRRHARSSRADRRLFRGLGRHYHPGPARPGARIAGRASAREVRFGPCSN